MGIVVVVEFPENFCSSVHSIPCLNTELNVLAAFFGNSLFLIS